MKTPAFQIGQLVKYVGCREGCRCGDYKGSLGAWTGLVGKLAYYNGDFSEKSWSVEIRLQGEHFPRRATVYHLKKDRVS